ncbi:hypothetical protein AAMO2058_000667300 [Amorphochlora amoebiformis]
MLPSCLPQCLLVATLVSTARATLMEGNESEQTGNIFMFTRSHMHTHRRTCRKEEPNQPQNPTCSLDDLTLTFNRLVPPESTADFAAHWQKTETWHNRGTDPDRFNWIFILGELDNILSNLSHREKKSDKNLSGGGSSGHVSEYIPPTLDDFKVLKRIEKGGEFWSGVMPLEKLWKKQEDGDKSPRLDVDLIKYLFNRRKFSILINGLHARHSQVELVTRDLARDFGATVNANLYLTPQGSTAFEWHWDYMESIVLQLYGSKSWNIYPAAIPLSFKSQKRRPEPHEVSNVSVKVTLNVGDLMYIPSGVIHEAYTLDNSISMHLTLGIFYPEVCSYAGLLHSLLTVNEELTYKERCIVHIAVASATESYENVMIRRRVETCDATFSRLQVQVSNQKSSIECKEASEIVIRHTLTNLMLTLKSVAFSQVRETKKIERERR